MTAKETAFAGAEPGTAGEPIAILGMACRFPGGITSPEQLWKAVVEGRDLIGPLPTDRGWDIPKLFWPDSGKPGTFYVRKGGFLADAAQFDAELFGISPREALAMHPQQRILLELAWEACERSWLDPLSLRESDTGVFIGAFATEYGPRMHEAGDGSTGYMLTGTTLSVQSGRIAYALGLVGPAVTIDTACSSSLAAIHQAVGSLRNAECSLALAGGASVLGAPGLLVDFSRQQALSRDGRSRAFSADADGFGMAEGAGMLVLARLSDAERLGRPVLGVIRGSALSQDGASQGLAVPHGGSQELVIRQALRDAGLQADEVDLVEAHGTGTRVGDPIEARSVIAVYGRERGHGRPVFLGSVKSNIGHCMAAAGVAGVIKAVLAVQHGVLPKTLHAERLNPDVDWSDGLVRLLHRNRDWPETDQPRRAGVSAYGISGTNAHLILEQSSLSGPPECRRPASPAALPLPWVLTARSPEALRAQADRLLRHLQATPELQVADVSWTLVTSRARLEHRGVVVGSDREELMNGLRALAVDAGAPNLAQGAGTPGARTVFIFPGQGSQWAGMAAELLEQSPVFARRIAECADALAPYADWSLTDVLRAGPDVWDHERVDVVQPTLFAVMVSLAALWRDHGVVPDAVMGHSQGEMAAAVVAGALSLEDGMRVVALRSRALRALAGTGTMAAVALPAETVADRPAFREGRLSVAAVNGPGKTVVSGDTAAVAALLTELEAEGVWARRVAVDFASHSAHVERIRDRLLDDLAGIRPKPSQIPFYSTVTGGLLDTAGMNAAYWFTNLRDPVRFDPTLRAVLASGHQALIEVSPHPVLTMGMQETVEDVGGDAAVLGTLRRGEGGLRRFRLAVAEAEVRGVPVTWARAFTGTAPRRVDLPTYAFQHRRYWLDADGSRTADLATAGLEDAGHPLLGAATGLAGSPTLLLTGSVSIRTHPWLADHAVHGTVLFPGTAFLEMALQAADRAGFEGVEELVLQAPLVLTADQTARIQVQVHEHGLLEIFSRPESAPEQRPWTRHATGSAAGPAPIDADDLAAWPPEGATPVPLDGFYDRLAATGYQYGPAFRGLQAAWSRDDEVFVEVALPDDLRDETASYSLHPALLDAALHGALTGAVDRLQMPFSWQDVRLHAVGASALRARLARTGPDTMAVTIADPAGRPVLTARSLVLRTVERGQLRAVRTTGRGGLFRLDWPASPPDGTEPTALTWALIGGADRDGATDLALPEPPTRHPDVASLRASVAAGAAVPDVAVLVCPRTGVPEDAAPLHATVDHVLAEVQTWLTSERLDAGVLLVLTRGAVAVHAHDPVTDLAQAAVWGAVRTAQTEHPGRLVLVDLDDHEASRALVATALATGEPQSALRAGALHVPRLAEARTADAGAFAPDEGPWCLDMEPGTLESLRIVPASERPLGPGEVRVAVRAAAMNFRDVAVAAGIVDRHRVWPLMGFDGAGVVVETGPGVTDVASGDRVMGAFTRSTAFAGTAVTDRRLVVPVPEEWTFQEAATAPVAFLTAWYGLVELAALRPGESVLVHAATGGVGLAAVQIARHLGAEVFATAAPAKQAALRALGLDEAHIASSRSTAFERHFRATTRGAGVDVVLNCLSGDIIDAGLRLLVRGGRFVELGRTDLRGPDVVARDHPGVTYLDFDLGLLDPDLLHAMLGTLHGLFRRGDLHALPFTSWDIRHARAAFEHMRRAEHIGKIVLTVPRPLDPAGTVLITGGTGTLGSLLARHLVTEHGVRHLLLIGRRGPDAPGADALRAELADLGAEVTIAVCDAADREALRRLLDDVPAEHPLTAVVHTAAVVEDGVITSLTPEMNDRVLRPKADAALNLHVLTRDSDLAAFVLYSSMAAVLSAGGQANYSAANALVDALALHRSQRGLPATSLAWGLWERTSELTGRLVQADLSRLAYNGMLPLTDRDGLALFDAALADGGAFFVAAHLDLRTLGGRSQDASPPLLRNLVHPKRARASVGPTGPADTDAEPLGERLASLPTDDRVRELLHLVRTHAATVLGHSRAEAVDADRPFREMGFDSLAAVQLRNHMNKLTGLKLPTTVVFDHPTPRALARRLDSLLAAATAAEPKAPANDDNILRLRRILDEGADLDEEIALLQEILNARDGSITGDPAELSVRPVRLSDGHATPRLFCLPSILAPAAPLQYAEFAGFFQGHRSVHAVTVPGYSDGESLPGALDTFTRAAAATVLDQADGSPFVILGHSSGAWLAHAVAEHCEKEGRRPAGLAFLDPADIGRHGRREVTRNANRLWGRLELGTLLDEAGVSAMMHYTDLFAGWTPREIACPILALRADEAMDGVGAEWTRAHLTAQVPGDHLTMMTTHVEETARAVESWIRGLT
ncbi:SDR family NAD(P)-dependent oxidoreductase [Spirillospora sp. CA-253888]